MVELGYVELLRGVPRSATIWEDSLSSLRCYIVGGLLHPWRSAMELKIHFQEDPALLTSHVFAYMCKLLWF